MRPAGQAPQAVRWLSHVELLTEAGARRLAFAGITLQVDASGADRGGQLLRGG